MNPTHPFKKTSLKGKARAKANPEEVPSVRWAFLVPGLALTFLGIMRLSGFHPDFKSGFPFQFLGFALVWAAFPKDVFSPPAEKAPIKTKVHGNLGLLTGVLVLLAFSQLCFRFGMTSLAWLLGLGAVAGVGWWSLQVKGPAETPAPEGPAEKWWFALVLLFAAILRFAFVGTHVTGFQGDEANNLTDTLGITQGLFDKGPFVMGWGGTPVLPDYIVAFFLRIFGEKMWVARSVSALASLGTIWFFHRWCRFWMGATASLMATFFLANAWWFFFFSLSPFHNSILFLFQVCAFYFLEKGLRTGSKNDFLLSGLCAAASVMNYVPGRSVPAALFLTLLATALLRGWPFAKRLGWPIFLGLYGFAWLLTPYLLDALQIPTEFWGRVDPHWIQQEHDHSGGYFFLVKSYFFTFQSLWAPDPSMDLRFAPVGLPFIDPFAGAFAFLGFGMVFFRLLRPATWVLIPAVFFALSANALARLGWPTDLAYVHAIRYSIMIPFLFLACGRGLDWLLRLFKATYPKGEKLSPWLLGAVLLGSLALNEPVFIKGFNGEKGSWGEHGFSQIALANYMLSKADDHQFLADADIISNTVTFLVHEKTAAKWLFLDKDIPVPYKADKNVMLLFAPWRITEAQKAKIHSTYPTAQWGDIKTPWGDPYVTTVDIPLAAVEAAQKGMSVTESLP